MTTTATEKTATVLAAPINVGNRGLVLKTLDDYWRYASFIVKAGVAPKDMKSPEAIVVALQLGAEVGLPPMAALQNVMVINGRPSLYGDAQLAVVRDSGKFDDAAFREWFEGEGDDYAACCTVRRRGGGQPITQRFSIRQAKKAKLWTKSGPWTDYPERMLQWRARGWALRDGFSDALKGLSLSVEEAHDIPTPDMIDVEPLSSSVMPTPEPGQSANEALAEHLTKPKSVDDVAKQEPKKASRAAKPKPALTEEAPGPLAAVTPADIDVLFLKLSLEQRAELRKPERYDFKSLGDIKDWEQPALNSLHAAIKQMLEAKA
jgi:hypothetical protein